MGGEYQTAEDPNMAGPFAAKADATTGKQIWSTYLDNLNASGRWIANANLNILDNGKIVMAWANQVVLLDPDTGEILKHNTLPGGETPIGNVNFKHLTIAPDRTLILKDQTRPADCDLQGTIAIIKCGMQGKKQTSSILVAVNPDTLDVLDQLQDEAQRREGTNEGRTVHRQLQGAAYLAQLGNRQDHRRVGFFRAAVHQRAHAAGLRWARVLPDRGWEGLLRPAGHAKRSEQPIKE